MIVSSIYSRTKWSSNRISLQILGDCFENTQKVSVSNLRKLKATRTDLSSDSESDDLDLFIDNSDTNFSKL